MPPTVSVRSTGGVSLALHDLGGDGPPVLLCHPTGFHALTWAPVAAELSGVARCWALDFRGHGDSTLPGDGHVEWDGMADDVLAVVGHLGLRGLRAAGHSMGGAALVLAEQRRPGTVAALWLFEPILFPRPEGAGPGPSGLSEGARRRRPWFPDLDAAYANYAAKPPLDRLHPAALRAYVDHGFRDVPDGDGVELKCPPEIEAAVFEAGTRSDGFAHLGEVAAPVVVAASGDQDGPAQFAPAVAAALPHGRLERHPDLTHFGPMENPPAVAAAIRAGLGLG